MQILMMALWTNIASAGGQPAIEETPDQLIPVGVKGIAWFGDATSAGDIDDDGFADVVVSATYGFGSFFAYHGSSSGIEGATPTRISPTDGVSGDIFGAGLAVADVNGDGFDDVVATAYRNDAVAVESGAAYVFLGDPVGVDPSTEQKLTASDATQTDLFGYAADAAGDVDQDGYGDVIIGAVDDERGFDAGAAYLYLGSSAGLSSTNETKIIADDVGASDYFGATLAGVGDVNSDGFPDVAIGAYADDDAAPNAGAVYLYLGSVSGLSATPAQKITASDASGTAAYGSVAGAGDVNSDGYADIIVGAYGWAMDTGAAYVYLGSDAGVDTKSEVILTSSDSSYIERYGAVLDGAGDLDGDGFDDIIVGAGFSQRAYVYLGSVAGIDPATETFITGESGETDDQFGSAVTGAGDVDGDGLADVAIGAPYTQPSGAAFVYTGNCRTPIEWYADLDADGAGDPSSTQSACSAPDGYVDNADDCDDTEPLAWTGADETCDLVDNDCNGTVDDNALDAADWYADLDGDGFTTDDSAAGCSPPSGFAAASHEEDCDDNNSGIFPGADEIADDGIDQDCDGVDDEAGAEGDSKADNGDSGCGCGAGPAHLGLLWWVLPAFLVSRRRH